MSRRMDISPLFLSGGWSFFPKQLANASDFALSTLAIIAFPGKIRNEGGRKKYISTEMSENKGQNDRLYDELRGIETRIESFFYVLFYKHLGHSEVVNHDDPAFVKLVYHLH